MPHLVLFILALLLTYNPTYLHTDHVTHDICNNRLHLALRAGDTAQKLMFSFSISSPKLQTSMVTAIV